MPLVLILALICSAKDRLFHPRVNHHFLSVNTQKHEELKRIISDGIDAGGPGTEHSKMRCVLYKLQEVENARKEVKEDPNAEISHLFSLVTRRSHMKYIAVMACDTELKLFLLRLKQFHPTFKGLTKFRRQVETHFGNFRVGLIDGIHRIAALQDILMNNDTTIPENCINFECTANFSVMKNTNTSVPQFLLACSDLSLYVKNAVKSGVEHTVHDSILDLITHVITGNHYIVVEDIGFYSLLLNMTSKSDKVRARDLKYSDNTRKVTNEFAQVCHRECMKVLDYQDKNRERTFLHNKYSDNCFSPFPMVEAEKYIVHNMSQSQSSLTTALQILPRNYFFLRFLEPAIMSKPVAGALMRAFTNIASKSSHEETSYSFFLKVEYHANKFSSAYTEEMLSRDNSKIRQSPKSRKWKKKNGLCRLVANQMYVNYIEGISYWYCMSGEDRDKVAKLVTGGTGKYLSNNEQNK